MKIESSEHSSFFLRILITFFKDGNEIFCQGLGIFNKYGELMNNDLQF